MPLPLGDVPHHRIARHRLAALGVADQQAIHSLDLDAPAQPDPVEHPAEHGGLGLGQLVVGEVRIEGADDLADGQVAPPHRRLEPDPVRHAQRGGGAGERRVVQRAQPSSASSPASRISRPSWLETVSSSCRIHCLILWRARPVRTCWSQSRLGRAWGEVRISTVSPFLSSRCSGAIRPLILLPWQRVPTSVCTWKAKSIAVAPLGSRFTSPCGVKTKISSW